METDKGARSGPADDRTDDEDTGTLGSVLPIVSPLRTVLTFFGLLLLVVLLGIGLLLFASVLVVYAASHAARWFSLSELHLMVAFLGLLATLVLSLLGSRIGSQVAVAGREIRAAITGAGERVGDEVNASAEELVGSLRELPVVVLDGEPARRGQTTLHEVIDIGSPGRSPRARKSPRRERR